jgi:hypothetical protein
MRRGFRVPAVLAVSSLGAAIACGSSDDGTTSVATTGTESSSTASDATDPSTTTTGATTTTTESGDAESSGGSSSGLDSSDSLDESSESGGNDCPDTGHMPACELTDQTGCEAVEICEWTDMGDGTGYCHADCTLITDETTCCGQYECRWFNEMCEYNGL